MTTVAWDGEHLAADSQAYSGSGLDQTPTQKIFRRQGKTFAVAGDYAQALAVIDWLCGGEKPQFYEPNYSVWVMDTKGVKLYADQLYPHPVSPPFAMGCGSQFAMGALLAGATAYEAVSIASKLDPDTGGKIRTRRTI